MKNKVDRKKTKENLTLRTLRTNFWSKSHTLESLALENIPEIIGKEDLRLLEVLLHAYDTYLLSWEERIRIQSLASLISVMRDVV